MIVQYNKLSPEHRTLIRSIENKSYVGYIRYLLLKRWSFERVRKELMRLGLAWNDKEDFEIYFQEVLYPTIHKFKLSKYYKKYRHGLSDSTLTYAETFNNSEKDRIAFVDLIKDLDVEQFFTEEIINYYGGLINLPTHPDTGEPLLSHDKPIDLVGMLQNPRRHVIEKLLLEGYTPKQISTHLFERYDMEIAAEDIKGYAKSFFNVKRHDVQRLLDSLQTEKEEIEKRLSEIKRRPPDDFSIGERFELISVFDKKIEELNNLIKRLSTVHTNATFNAAVLEFTDMREMFQDVMVRAHKRFREMDERTEDDIVGPLNSIVNMMSKATDKIISIDDIVSENSNKSINEEMLEVILPTLDRIQEEEREAMYSYREHQDSEIDEDEKEDEILGFD